MRDLIVLVEQPGQQKVLCSSCVEPRIRGCQEWFKSSSFACPERENMAPAPRINTTTETAVPTRNPAFNLVNDHLNVSHQQEICTHHYTMQDTTEVLPSLFELYDEPLYIDFVPPSSEQKWKIQNNKSKKDEENHHPSGCGSAHDSQLFMADIESRRFSINLLVAACILNTAIAYHRLSCTTTTTCPALPVGKWSKQQEVGKRNAQRLYQKCINLMTVLLHPSSQETNSTTSSSSSCCSRRLCTFIMLASMNNLLCIIEDSSKDQTADDSIALRVQYCQHVNALSSRKQERRHHYDVLSSWSRAEERWSSSYNNMVDGDDDSTTDLTLSIAFCQKWIAVCEENAITMQLKHLGILLPLRTAVAAWYFFQWQSAASTHMQGDDNVIILKLRILWLVWPQTTTTLPGF